MADEQNEPSEAPAPPLETPIPDLPMAHVAQRAMLLRAGAGAFGFPGNTDQQCVLCGRSRSRARKVLVARGLVICDRCVEDAAAALASSGDAPVVRFRPRDVAPPNTFAPMQPAHFVRVDGRWKLTGDTMVRFAGMAGVPVHLGA